MRGGGGCTHSQKGLVILTPKLEGCNLVRLVSLQRIEEQWGSRAIGDAYYSLMTEEQRLKNNMGGYKIVHFPSIEPEILVNTSKCVSKTQPPNIQYHLWLYSLWGMDSQCPGFRLCLGFRDHS